LHANEQIPADCSDPYKPILSKIYFSSLYASYERVHRAALRLVRGAQLQANEPFTDVSSQCVRGLAWQSALAMRSLAWFLHYC
jgi:hypothetical protein